VNVYTYPEMDLISSNVTNPDGSWTKTEVTEEEGFKIKTVTRSNEQKTREVRDPETDRILIKESWNVDRYYAKETFTHLDNGIHFASTVESHTMEGAVSVEQYEYLQNSPRLMSSTVTQPDGSKTEETYQYDFENDVLTVTTVKNGEETVVKTRISTGEVIE